MATTTNVKQVKLNKMTKAQYDSATKSATELYTTVDESIDYSDLVNTPSLATVATTGSYDDLTDKPIIPAAQVNSDWNANSGVAQILNKPTLATVATTGSYNDLSDKPTLNTFTSATQRNAINSGITSSLVSQITTNKNDITTINSKIPSQATSSNQLADKAFVNSTVQTNTANFRGSWATWSAVPTSASDYPADYTGSKTPTVNDYLVIQNASDYTGQTLTGTWRFKYNGVWSTSGKSGWIPEYQVNETPMTAAQLAAINSGITDTKVGNYDTHIGDTTIHVTSTDKTNWDGKVDKVSSASKIYGTNSSSAQTTYSLSSSATASTIAYRGTGGVLSVGTPTANAHAATKAYVDGIIPAQSGQSGKFLTTNGSAISWADVPSTLPSQTGQSGKYLTTDGTTPSWATVDALPSQSGNSGKYLTTNGTTASWAEISEYTAAEVTTLWNSI